MVFEADDLCILSSCHCEWVSIQFPPAYAWQGMSQLWSIHHRPGCIHGLCTGSTFADASHYAWQLVKLSCPFSLFTTRMQEDNYEDSDEYQYWPDYIVEGYAGYELNGYGYQSDDGSKSLHFQTHSI